MSRFSNSDSDVDRNFVGSNTRVEIHFKNINFKGKSKKEIDNYSSHMITWLMILKDFMILHGKKIANKHECKWCIKCII